MLEIIRAAIIVVCVCRYYSANSLNEYIEGNLMYPGGDTNTTGGLEMTKDKVIGQAGDREPVRNVVVVITDGIPTFPKPNPRCLYCCWVHETNDLATLCVCCILSDNGLSTWPTC
jgi:Mg-chelatase subunit ChlD